MKLDYVHPEAVVDTEKTKFGLNMDAKMYSILTDKLYTNKEGAIIRELAANAKDAHIENGNPEVPFHIHLPSWLSNTFYIRDYGTGIEPSQFKKIYTTIGGSTKDQDNKCVGAFGLGNKTPFTLVDSYTIENYWYGTKYVYTAYKDKGFPTVSLIGETKTDEPNGLKVMFSGDNLFISKFTSEIKDQLRFFKVKPKVTGGSEDNFEWKDDILNKDDWCVDKKAGRYAYNQIFVVMGEVSYGADVNALNREIIKLKESICGYNSLFIKADIGDVDIPPSRENIELTKKSISFIEQQLEKIRDEYKDEYINKLESAKNLVEAYDIHKALENRLTKDITEFNYLGKHAFEISKFHQPTSQGLKAKKVQINTIKTYIKINVKPDELKLYEVLQYNSILILNDIPRGGFSYLREQKDEFRQKILKIYDKSPVNVFILPSFKKDEIESENAKLESYIKKYGKTVYKLSDLIEIPDKEERVKTRTYKIPDQIFKAVGERDQFNTLNLELVEELPKEGYYFKLTRHTPEYPEMGHFLKVADKPVYGLRSKAFDIAQKQGELEHISKLKLKALAVSNEYIKGYRKRQQITDFLQQMGISTNIIRNELKDNKWEHEELNKFFEYAREQIERSAFCNMNSYNAHLRFVKGLGIELKELKQEDYVDEEIRKIGKKMMNTVSYLISYLNAYGIVHKKEAKQQLIKGVNKLYESNN